MSVAFGIISATALLIGGRLLAQATRDTGLDLEEMENPEPPARPLAAWGEGEQEEAEAATQLEAYHKATHRGDFEQDMLKAIRGH